MYVDRKTGRDDRTKSLSFLSVFIYASNEPKSVLARDLGDCRDNLRNSRSVFLIVWRKCAWVIGKRKY